MEINLHQINLFLATMLYYSVLQSCAFRSDYGYVQSTGSYYKFHRDSANWDDANSRCQSEGAIMFHPENKDELVQALRAANVEMGIGWNIRSGFSDLRDNGFYETVEGYPISHVYDNWGKHQPERDFHCGSFMVTTLTIFVYDCSSPTTFMCKYKPINETVTTNVFGAFRSDYGYVESTGSYYKFHRDSANWDDANSRCQSEGAIMFHPENKDEFVQALRAANVEMGIGWNIRSGFSDLRDNGFYETVEGYPISHVYDNWGKHQPERDFHCGGFMVTTLTIFVYDCSSPTTFMCKYKPINETVTTNVFGAFRSDYGYAESTGSYYKFHNDSANWDDANSRCRSEGAIMFHPENKDELVQALRAANVEMDRGWNINSGFSDLRKNGFYETVEGYPISHVYDNWDEDQPKSGHHCGGFMVTSLTIFVYDCSFPSVFMCKYKPINETVTGTSEKTNTVPETSAAILDQPSGEMQRQAAFQTAALERMADAMQRQASTLEKMAGAFPSALHLLTAPKMKVIVTQEDSG